MKNRWAVYAGLGALLGLGSNVGAQDLESAKAQAGTAFGEDGRGPAHGNQPVFAAASPSSSWRHESRSPVVRRGDRGWARSAGLRTGLLIGGAVVAAAVIGMASCGRHLG